MRDETMDAIADALDHIRKVRLLTPRMAARLQPVDPLALQAGLLGSNPDGLFKVGADPTRTHQPAEDQP